jgi:hypothetical protein
MNNIKSKYFTQKIKKEETFLQEKLRPTGFEPATSCSGHHPTNKKPHECGAFCCRKGKSILAIPFS